MASPETFRDAASNLFIVGHERSRPATSRHSAQALHIVPRAGRELVAQCIRFQLADSAAAWSETMSEVTLFGFPRSVYVQMAGIVLHSYHMDYGAQAAACVDAFMAAINWPNVARRLAELHP